MNKIITSASLLAISAIGAQTAMAQSVSGDKPWSVQATLRGFYDDNYLTAPDGPGKLDSFGFEVRPSASLFLDLDQSDISLRYIYSLKYYDDRPDNKYDQSHQFEGVFNHAFNERYMVSVRDDFAISQEPEVLDSSLSTPIRTDGDNLRNYGTIDFLAQLTELWGFKTGYGNTYYNYVQDASDVFPPGTPSYSALLDRIEQSVYIDLRWTASPQTVPYIGYRYSQVGFTSDESISNPFVFPFTFVPSDFRNNRSHFGYVGAEHAFRNDFKVNGQIGAELRDYYNDPNADESFNPYANIDLSYMYNPNGTLSAGFVHQMNQTDVAGVTVSPGGEVNVTQDTETSTIYAILSHRITPKLTGKLSGQFQNSTFNGGIADGENEMFYLFGGNLTYQFNPYLSAELGYNYDNLDSDLPGRSYDRNRVYVGVTASY